MRVLAIGAHPDDELLGCGATAHKLTTGGNYTVRGVYLWPGRGFEDDNAMDKYPLLDTVRLIERMIAEFKPERIYVHSASDLNVDHVVAHRAAMTAVRPPTCVKEVYCFETASSTEWNLTGKQFHPNVFEAVSQDDMDYKLGELDRRYRAEMREFPHPRSSEYLLACATRWAAVAGVSPYAEAFELVRSVR